MTVEEAKDRGELLHTGTFLGLDGSGGVIRQQSTVLLLHRGLPSTKPQPHPKPNPKPVLQLFEEILFGGQEGGEVKLKQLLHFVTVLVEVQDSSHWRGSEVLDLITGLPWAACLRELVLHTSQRDWVLRSARNLVERLARGNTHALGAHAFRLERLLRKEDEDEAITRTIRNMDCLMLPGLKGAHFLWDRQAWLEDGLLRLPADKVLTLRIPHLYERRLKEKIDSLPPPRDTTARRDLVEAMINYARAPKLVDGSPTPRLFVLEDGGDEDDLLRAFSSKGRLPPCMEQLQRGWGVHFRRLKNDDRKEVVGALLALGYSVAAIHKWVRRMSTTVGDWDALQFDRDYGTPQKGKVLGIAQSMLRKNYAWGRDCARLQDPDRPLHCAFLDIEDLAERGGACAKLCPGREHPVQQPADWSVK